MEMACLGGVKMSVTLQRKRRALQQAYQNDRQGLRSPVSYRVSYKTK